MDSILIRQGQDGLGLFATEDVAEGSVLVKVSAQPSKDLNDVISSEKFAGISVDKIWQFVDLSGGNIEAINDLLRPEFTSKRFESYTSIYRSLIAYQKSSANTSLIYKDDEIFLVAKNEINKDEELNLQFGTAYWLHQATKANDIYVQIVAKIFLDTQHQLKFELTKWRSWTNTECGRYVEYLNVDLESDFCKDLIMVGYSSRVVVYRIFQAVGYIRPAKLSAYEMYPESLRTVAYESKELCFWPVEIDKASETKEKMRKKTVDSLEFGPNASWIPFPRTKLIYTAAKTNNLEMAKEAIVQGNIDAYGTCTHWTPLHVACFYGSKEVVEFLLIKGAIYNTKDTDGKLPLDLAEAQGHTGVAQSLLAQYTKDSLLVTNFASLKISTINEVIPDLTKIIECRNEGNESFKNSNFKSAFVSYSKGLEMCPENHAEKITLLSNRAQVLITAKAYNLALRDCRDSLKLDPTHEKTLLRMAHCYENVNKTKSLEVLDLMMFTTVPDKLVKERRTFLFLKSILNEPNVTEDSKDQVSKESTTIRIQEEECKLNNLPTDKLMELSLEALRDLDKKVGHFDHNY